jgi:hypothetical protein
MVGDVIGGGDWPPSFPPLPFLLGDCPFFTLTLPFFEAESDQGPKRLRLCGDGNLRPAEIFDPSNDVLSGSDRENPRFGRHCLPSVRMYCWSRQ